MKKIIMFTILFISLTFIYAKADTYTKEIRAMEELLSPFGLKSGEVHTCTKNEVEALLKEGAKYKLNLFEILYTTNVYLEKTGLRIVMPGSFLRELETKITYGNERVYALIPINIIEKVEVGPTKEDGKHILDIFLRERYEKYIEIGTAIYEKHIGFGNIKDNTFSNCFGMSVKKLGMKKQIDRILMYERTKIAIYVKHFPIPKKWIFENIYLKKAG